MSVFEDKIKRNKSYFEQKEPDAGHKDKFLDKLDQAGFEDQTIFHFSQVYKIAAVLLFMVSLGVILTYVTNTKLHANQTLVHSIEYSDDMKDILAYYDAISLEKVDEIGKLLNDSDQAEALKQNALQRLDDIDGSIASIEKELVKNPEDENIKSTIINIKRKKVKVMDDILMQLDFANTSLF